MLLHRCYSEVIFGSLAMPRSSNIVVAEGDTSLKASPGKGGERVGSCWNCEGPLTPTHQLQDLVVQLGQNPRHRAPRTKGIKEQKAAQRILGRLRVNFPCSSKAGTKGIQRRPANAIILLTSRTTTIATTLMQQSTHQKQRHSCNSQFSHPKEHNHLGWLPKSSIF